MNRNPSERPVKPRRPMRRSMAELAESLQNSLGENAAVTHTPLDYANALADARLPLNSCSERADQPGEQEIESGRPQQDRRLLATAEAAHEYRVMAFKLMTANVRANLEYALKLTRLTSPLEFIELSTTHARKQFELIISQTVAFGALSRSLTMTNANE